jgi:hypothetical protein
MKIIVDTAACNEGRLKFIFDGFVHSNGIAFSEFCEKIGKPQFIIALKADLKTIQKRYNLANEAEEDAEIGEEPLEELKNKIGVQSKEIEDLKDVYAPNAKNMKFVDFDTGVS